VPEALLIFSFFAVFSLLEETVARIKWKSHTIASSNEHLSGEHQLGERYYGGGGEIFHNASQRFPDRARVLLTLAVSIVDFSWRTERLA
jgi:hypothetical protein